MKFRLRSKTYTFMMIRDAKSSVLRFRIPGFVLVAVPALAACLAVSAFASFALSFSSLKQNKELQSRLDGQNEQFLSTVTDKDQTIEHLQNDLLTLSKNAEELKARMEEIRKLGEEMKDLTGLNTGTGSNAAPANSQDASNGIGGRSRPATDEDFAQLIQDTRKKYEDLSTQMTDLHGNLNETKDKVLERQHQLAMQPTIWPSDYRNITSGFGLRRDPFSFKLSFHSGLDIGAPANSPVFAAAEGTVESTGQDSSHGKNIIINHDKGIKTWYMHLNQIEVARGDAVSKGQQIGLVGSTGRSTGPHLHYEVIKNGQSVDPKPYLIGSRKEE